MKRITTAKYLRHITDKYKKQVKLFSISVRLDAQINELVQNGMSRTEAEQIVCSIYTREQQP